MKKDAAPRHEHTCPTCRRAWTCYRGHLAGASGVAFLEECNTCFVVRIARIEMRLRARGIEAKAPPVHD